MKDAPRSEDIWPNFFIVGAMRAGTTSLYSYLKDVPSVYLSPVKEPCYFIGRRVRDRADYLELFKGVKNETAIGEASPQYLAIPRASENIHAVVPNARIIMILRDPIKRAFSAWFSSRRWRSLTFREMVQKEIEGGEQSGPRNIAAGMYSKHVQKYLDTFGKKQIKILIFEEFVKDIEAEMRGLLKFLDVDYDANGQRTFAAFNMSKRYKPRANLSIAGNAGIRVLARSVPSSFRKIGKKILLNEVAKPQLSAEDEEFLAQLFRDDVQALERILNRSLPWRSSGQASHS